MLRFLLLLLFLWPGYYFSTHPDDIHHPYRFVLASKDIVENTVDALPISYIQAERTHPPGVLVSSIPSIYRVEAKSWKIGNDTFTPLFGYHLHARVLSKMHYLMGKEAKYSPYDFALGWQEMSDTSVLAQIPVTQSNRWYYYTYPADPPLSPPQIPLKSGNMHMIPSTGDILHTLRKIVKGNVIEVAGYLVQINAPDGWQWKSGTSTTGEGQGSCKIIWITALRIEQ